MRASRDPRDRAWSRTDAAEPAGLVARRRRPYYSVVPKGLGETVAIPDLQGILLESKIQVPSPRPDAVSRRRLIDRARESRARVVSVTAPAGYGKSTMLAEWAALESRPVAWVALDRSDEDPAALLTVIATACATFAPSAAAVVAEMRGIGAASLGRSAPMLAAALAAAPTGFVLFLDDLHWADSADCQDAIEVLLSRVPQGSQIVMSSRREPLLLARLRMSGGAWEVTARDLALDARQARVVFERAGVTVSDDDLKMLVDRCEGWPTGIFLCVLLARAGGDPASISGDDRYLADYLYRECVGRLPDDTQAFLRRTAVLEQLSAAPCNALLQTDDARARLQEIEAANLFLVPLDHTRGWYRYHALFREFLLAELERSEGAAAVAALHRRAADWHDAHGLRAVAVEHLLRADDVGRAAQVVAEIALPMYQSGEVTAVDRWMSALGEDIVRAYPPLAVIAAWTAILLGRTAEGERRARIVDEIDVTAFEGEERILLESARAMVRAATCADGYEQAMIDAEFAYQHEPAWSPWRDQALHLYGSVCLLSGEVEVAREAFEEAVSVATAAGNSDSIILSEPELAILAMDQDRWVAAGEHARHGVETVEANHMDGYPTTALALAVAARVALHHGDQVGAGRLLSRAMLARVGCTYLLPFLSMRVRLQLAKTHMAMGDRTAARHLLHEIDDLLRRRPGVGVLRDEIDSFRRTLDSESEHGGSVPLTPAELRLLPYLQTHLTIAEIGQRLFVSRNTVSSQLGSIYRKLGVTTRGAAVERANLVGLLGG